MKARKRFVLLFAGFVVSTVVYLGLNRLWPSHQHRDHHWEGPLTRTPFYTLEHTFGAHFETPFHSDPHFDPLSTTANESRECRMSSCFDFRPCLHSSRLRVHIYGPQKTLSQSLAKIVSIIKTSNFFESDPNKACLFLCTLWDTVDRDPLSRDYQKSSQLMASFEPLFGGRNHIVFNLYAGSWPQYHELDLQFPSHAFGHGIDRILANAIFIKASQSLDAYRQGYDVSLPLFARSHPTRGPPFVATTPPENSIQYTHERSLQTAEDDDRRQRRRYLLVFKGKRYIYGIGSETRNALHYLNNEDDVLILTTCRHGKKWKDWKDDKCDEDNHEYDKHDFSTLMANSTFCLVPRGRRLASYRFLEALAVGCVPVVLANSWVLPFQEIIDWSECVVISDERLLLQIPETLRAFSDHKIARMRARCLALYETYFASVERIVLTSLLIVDQRIRVHSATPSHVWNLATPALTQLVAQSQLGLRPHTHDHDISGPTVDGFTALIHVQNDQQLGPTLQRLVQKSLLACPLTRQIVILWSVVSPVPHYLVRSARVHIVRPDPSSRNHTSLANKFNSHLIPVSTLTTDAVFQLSANAVITSEEMEFAFGVWRHFPQRVVGFTARDHYYNADKQVFEYSSRWTNRYSLLAMDACLYHKTYHQLFTDFFIDLHNGVVDLSEDSECSDLAFAFLVSHVSREAPIKVSQRKRAVTSGADTWLQWSERRICFERLQQVFGYLPLVSSHLRLDPVLYKDMVSVRRKKWPRMESLS